MLSIAYCTLLHNILYCLMSITPKLNFALNKIENNLMVGACGWYGGGESLIQVFWMGILGKDPTEGTPA